MRAREWGRREAEKRNIHKIPSAHAHHARDDDDDDDASRHRDAMASAAARGTLAQALSKMQSPDKGAGRRATRRVERDD
jgi:hypothetical protein